MALVWSKQAGDSLYEVRSHGATIRLYSNGVFHSQWNARDPLKGSFWELLFLPVFFRPAERVRRVLILGVGGGALIRLLQRFVEPEQIVGVDIDRHHLTVARRYFGVRGAELVCADARHYVAQAAGSNLAGQFDLIVDDLFGHTAGVAERAISADLEWCGKLLALLSPDGLVVSNFGSRRELLESGWRSARLQRQLQGGWRAELPGYENSIGIFSREKLQRRALAAHAPLAINPANPSRRLGARLTRLR
ncbi:spermidine synthase [Microbulbifer sp. Q7]|uniref:spermidine synthase n=1 Tax=Microbulbifer sp. Q7 TaxID=1785091 RepID=UPI0008326766|nr:methyltransferase domain-containing protein [Microbulbifer sp. Q7]